MQRHFSLYIKGLSHLTRPKKSEKDLKTTLNWTKSINETVKGWNSANFFRFNGFFLPPFSRLDVRLYASRLEKRRFSPKSDYPKKRLSQNRIWDSLSFSYYFWLIPTDVISNLNKYCRWFKQSLSDSLNKCFYGFKPICQLPSVSSIISVSVPGERTKNG